MGIHDDDLGVLLPSSKRPKNVGFRLAETVHKICIEVVLAFLDVIIVGASFQSQSDVCWCDHLKKKIMHSMSKNSVKLVHIILGCQFLVSQKFFWTREENFFETIHLLSL